VIEGSMKAHIQHGYLVQEVVYRGATHSHHSRTLVAPLPRSVPGFPFAFTFPDVLFRIGILLTAVWDPRAGCVITSTDNTILSATFIYSMCFDFIVLCLTGYKLSVGGNRSRLVHLIFSDGLVYFFVAYVWQFHLVAAALAHLISSVSWPI
jgi:hypothetical protein